jgi:hypothetical protein
MPGPNMEPTDAEEREILSDPAVQFAFRSEEPIRGLFLDCWNNSPILLIILPVGHPRGCCAIGLLRKGG